MKTLIDLTFILNGALGIICTILILISIKSNRNVNIYLAIMTLGAAIRFISRGYLELTDQVQYIADFSKSIAFVFSFAFPCLYFKHLVFPKLRFEYKSLLHFILPTILIVENNLHLIENLIEVELNGVITFLLVAQAIYYFTFVYLLLHKHIWKKPGQLEMETEQTIILKKWTIVLFITFTIMLVRLLSALFFMQNKEYISDNYFVWINSAAWFVVFMMILTSPSILNGYISEISKVANAVEFQTKQTSNWRTKPTAEISNAQDLQLSIKLNLRLEEYFVKIDEHIEKENNFLDPGFTIEDLANKLMMPKSHLNFLFKYHSETSFSDFKKVVRIKKALELIEAGYLKTNTFESLSIKVGFSTYNTFYTSFKEVTGLAPQKFIDSNLNLIPA
ncbi:MAG: helix-turn-helix transcriptional regulator [Crocinitomicaceae bacterium]|nr:helix-turn-helix transcriptional regulator [Crocinitomicaceae bacterium]MBP6032630.1 helix-turn-helix transcriptional regulator [Crocinitomicaceae bacterium]